MSLPEALDAMYALIQQHPGAQAIRTRFSMDLVQDARQKNEIMQNKVEVAIAGFHDRNARSSTLWEAYHARLTEIRRADPRYLRVAPLSGSVDLRNFIERGTPGCEWVSRAPVPLDTEILGELVVLRSRIVEELASKWVLQASRARASGDEDEDEDEDEDDDDDEDEAEEAESESEAKKSDGDGKDETEEAEASETSASSHAVPAPRPFPAVRGKGKGYLLMCQEAAGRRAAESDQSARKRRKVDSDLESWNGAEAEAVENEDDEDYEASCGARGSRSTHRAKRARRGGMAPRVRSLSLTAGEPQVRDRVLDQMRRNIAEGFPGRPRKSQNKAGERVMLPGVRHLAEGTVLSEGVLSAVYAYVLRVERFVAEHAPLLKAGAQSGWQERWIDSATLVGPDNVRGVCRRRVFVARSLLQQLVRYTFDYHVRAFEASLEMAAQLTSPMFDAEACFVRPLREVQEAAQEHCDLALRVGEEQVGEVIRQIADHREQTMGGPRAASATHASKQYHPEATSAAL